MNTFLFVSIVLMISAIFIATFLTIREGDRDLKNIKG